MGTVAPHHGCDISKIRKVHQPGTLIYVNGSSEAGDRTVHCVKLVACGWGAGRCTPYQLKPGNHEAGSLTPG